MRSAVFGFVIWAAYTGLAQSDILPGIGAACVFGFFIVRHNRGGHWLHLTPLPGFILFFIAQSFLTGLHVAWLAVSSRTQLTSDWITLESRLPEGAPRALFSNMISLLPGTLCGDLEEKGIHHIHLLHADNDPVPELRILESRVGRLFGYEVLQVSK